MRGILLRGHLSNLRQASFVALLVLFLLLSACATPTQPPNDLTTQPQDQVFDHHTIVQVVQIGHYDYNVLQSWHPGGRCQLGGKENHINALQRLTQHIPN